MDTGQALTRFFQRNSEKAATSRSTRTRRTSSGCGCIQLGVFLQKPATSASPMTATTCRRSRCAGTRSDRPRGAGAAERDGQGRLFKNAARSACSRPRGEARQPAGAHRQDARDHRRRSRTITGSSGTTSRRSARRSRRRAGGSRRASTARRTSRSAKRIDRLQDGRFQYLGDQAGDERRRVQLPAHCHGDLPRHRLQVPRLHPGDPPHPALRAEHGARSTSSTPRPSASVRELQAKWAEHDEMMAGWRDHPPLRAQPRRRDGGR
jgi:hypothetical protein